MDKSAGAERLLAAESVCWGGGIQAKSELGEKFGEIEYERERGKHKLAENDRGKKKTWKLFSWVLRDLKYEGHWQKKCIAVHIHLIAGSFAAMAAVGEAV